VTLYADDRRVRLIKLVHTAVWAGFAGCIVAIPVLALNRWRCPLTPIAARYTDDRRANFDIYLPEWLARHNKGIFGSLYLAGVVLLAVRWILAGA
jgi:hypothetical protein